MPCWKKQCAFAVPHLDNSPRSTANASELPRRKVFPLLSRNIGVTIRRITDLERLRRGFFRASALSAQRISKLSMHMSQANRIVKRSLILVVRVAR